MTDQQSPPSESVPEAAAPTASVDDQKLMAVLAYLLWPVPLIVARDKPFVLFHLRQATVLICLVIPLVLVSIVGSLISGWISCIVGLIGVGISILAVLGIINAAQGNEKQLPLVGQFADKLPFP